ncbi:UvrD-helicase domain-containing protein [Paenibacillus massiliensis]|uniref:UvrD-helicase domain-containing protein n=1 Tax=Paenibacillus massiliensis TaxID=225917 RepID=UPI00037B65EF|nr:UvrD-helicase domain-containing protein [Paenibacillus massiliensis]
MTKQSIPKPEGSIWSDDQWEAISRSGQDMLVAAAAGSGKTAVLVERIIRKIADPESGYSVDRLLVATFTKAAAAEMRHRIREALERSLEENSNSEHIRRQLALLGRASITTLHSFCMEVIRRHYQSIPLDPGFRIMNEHETEIMRQELLEEIFEEQYGLHPEGSAFRSMVDWFSGERTDDAVYGLVQRLYDFSRSHPWPEYWLRSMAAAFRTEDLEQLGRSAWVRSIQQDAILSLRGAANLLEQARETAVQPGGPAPYAVTVEEELHMVRDLLQQVEQEPWDSLYDAFQEIAFGKLKPVKKDQTDQMLQERVKALRDSAKKTITELKSSLFGRRPEQFLAELHDAAPLMEELTRVIQAFAERFRQEKQSRGLVDFNDLEHYCLHILRHPDSTPGQLLPSDAALEYRALFDEVLLDEYQDTNTVQEDIVRLLAREQPGNRFMVGDVKQSIYRFRLAEPGLFLDKYHRFGLEENEGLLIDLARNFRSRREVVDAVNLIFSQIMSAEVAEIVYDERAMLVHGASFPEASAVAGLAEDMSGQEKYEQAEHGQEEAVTQLMSLEQKYEPELLLIERTSSQESYGSGSSGLSSSGEEDDAETRDEEELAELETARLEARLIVRRIKELIGDTAPALPVYDKALKAMRPARYGDIVILLRSAALWAPLIMEELRLASIPAAGEQTKGYFKATEVEIILSLLQIIDNPRQDIPLAAVLRSPIVGLSEEELARIRLQQPSGSFYDAVQLAVSPLETQGIVEAAVGLQADAHKQSIEESRLGHFMHQLEEWRRASRLGRLSELIWRLYQETGYLDWVGGLPGGMQRQSNLKALYDRARLYEQSTSNRGLFRFLTFLNRLREHGGDLGAVATETDTDQAVRIMTIHKSKGLEFPIVFVAGTAKMFNRQDLNMPFLMHKELGFGPKYVAEKVRVSYPTLAHLAIRRRLQLELLAEEIRVLYVALTRPREKLIMTGTVRDLAARVLAWSGVSGHDSPVLPDYVLASARSYLDWLGPALIRHPSAAVLREAVGLEHEVRGASSIPSALLQGDWQVHVHRSDELLMDQGVSTDAVADKVVDLAFESRIRALRAGQVIVTGNMDKQEHGAVTGDKTEEYRTVEYGGEEEAVQEKSTAAEILEQAQIVDTLAALTWTYPYALAGQIAASTSATEMKRTADVQEQLSVTWEEWQGADRPQPTDSLGRVDTPAEDSPTNKLAQENLSQGGTTEAGKSVRQATVPLSAGKTSSLQLRRPRFMENKALSPTERGTVYHTMLLHLPLQGPITQESIEATRRHLVDAEILLEQHAAVVDAVVLERIFASPIGQRMLTAEQVWREQPFSYALPVNEYLRMSRFRGDQEPLSSRSTEIANDKVMVKGIVDCMFEDSEGLVLIDYKTDQISEYRTMDRLVEQYSFQLELYARVMKGILHKPVAECWLCFLETGEFVRVEGRSDASHE